MTRDPRWDAIARTWLEDAAVPDTVIDRYLARCAQRLQDAAEELPDDIAQWEQDRDDAARDAYWDRKIDEARGK